MLPTHFERKQSRPLGRSATMPADGADGTQGASIFKRRLTKKQRAKDELFVTVSDHVGDPATDSPQSSYGDATKPPKTRSTSHRARRNEGIADSMSNDNPHWNYMAQDFEEHDEKRTRRWYEQIDTLLVFAGLFSAVATAFLVEFYKGLTPDPTDKTNHYLEYIASQLPNLPVAASTGNVSSASHLIAAPTPFNFQVNPTIVAINALWFSSLVFALIASSISTLVKQWIQAYADIPRSSPREQIRVRQYRYAGLKRWQVAAIVDIPPLLMRVALTLFLSGVVSFLWSLNSAILVWTATVPILLWFLLYAASIILPSFFPDCPYRSPEAAIFYLCVITVRQTWRSLRSVVLAEQLHSKQVKPLKRARGNPTPSHTPLPKSWLEQEHHVKNDASLDVDILVTADQVFADICLAHDIRGCLHDLPGFTIIDTLRGILSQRLGVEWENIDWFMSSDEWKSRFPRMTKRCGEALIDIVIDAVELKYKAPTYSAWVMIAVQCLAGLLQVFDWGADKTDFDDRVLNCLVQLLSSHAFALTTEFHQHVLAMLRARPILCRSELGPLLPRLCAVASDSGEDSISLWAKSTTAVLSLACHTDKEHVEGALLEYFINGASNMVERFQRGTGQLTPDDVASLQVCLLKARELDQKVPGLCSSLCLRLSETLAGN